MDFQIKVNNDLLDEVLVALEESGVVHYLCDNTTRVDVVGFIIQAVYDKVDEYRQMLNGDNE